MPLKFATRLKPFFEGNHCAWSESENQLRFDKHWQQPVITEKYISELLTERNPFGTNVQVVCFPWATYIDLLAAGVETTAFKELDRALTKIPSANGKVRVTFCQHIHTLKLTKIFQRLNIHTLYWSHKTTSQHTIDGIEIKPLPLYPYIAEQKKIGTDVKPLSQRKHLFSFVGAVDNDFYLSDSRVMIKQYLATHREGCVIDTGDWHFDKMVYGEQIGAKPESDVERTHRLQNEETYFQIIADSVFCLCPSGSGPNSIRLWESIALGCIPVLLADTYDTILLTSLKIPYLQVPEAKSHINGLGDYLAKQFDSSYRNQLVKSITAEQFFIHALEH